MPLAKSNPPIDVAPGLVAIPAVTPGTAGPQAPPHPPRLSSHNNYSRFVGVMKLLLPALAVALLLLVALWPQLDTTNDRLGLDLSELSIEQPDNLSMLNARFSGFDGKNQPFVITADVANQAPENENLVTLELPKADITLDDGTWLALMAREGLYDRDVETLDLIGQVGFYHDAGFELHTESARIDLAAGMASGGDPVAGHGFFGEIEAAGFQMFERGERILFTGPSRLLVYPGAGAERVPGLGQ